MGNIFLERGLSQLPRVLGFMNREADSPSFGCCDRAYWHYQTVDFANARFQEACAVFALAYLNQDAENRYSGKDLLRKWSLAAAAFWYRQRHADGSVDESYPRERHFCATAFTLYSVTATFLLLNEKPPWDMNETGRFLIKHTNADVANQVACAAVALYNLYALTKERDFFTGFEKKLEELFALQNAQGAFCEYGGFDLGYDSITVSLLADIYRKTGREDVRLSAVRCIGHLKPFLGEDGYFCPDGMSRQTQFLYPFGFAVFDREILGKIENGLRKDTLLSPAWMDDRYCIPLTQNYLMTAQEMEGK